MGQGMPMAVASRRLESEDAYTATTIAPMIG
jgi:hypothetical protein